MTPFFWLRWARRLLAVIVLGALLLFSATALRVWQVGRQDHRRHVDAIVVLGAAQFDGRPSETLQARLNHALALYRDGYAPRIVTVGGSQPGDHFTEAGAGVRYLARQGVPDAALIAVGQGSDTLLSLRAAIPLLRSHGWHTVLLVTDPWHSLRVRRIASDLGLAAYTSPTRSGPANHGRITELRYIGRESLAYLYYRAFHRASPPGPGAT